MLESKYDVTLGDIGCEESIDETKIGVVFFDPDFLVFDFEVHADVLDAFFAIPADAKPEVLVVLGIKGKLVCGVGLPLSLFSFDGRVVVLGEYALDFGFVGLEFIGS